MNSPRSFQRLLFFILCAGALSARGQNCTVNAGVPQTICITSPLTLTGTNNGLFAGGTSNFSWSKVAGPSAVIANATAASTAVTNLSAGVYTFRLSSVCQDGVTATNDVQVTVVKDVTLPDAGADQAPCVATAGTPVQLAANAPAAGETGSWTAVPTTNALFSSATSPTATFTGNSNQAYSVIWTLTNGTCQRRDTAKVNVTAGTSPVSAGPDQNLTCGGSAVTLAGSAPGLSPQGGFWTVVSGPSGAILSNATSQSATLSNLTTGTYLLEWAVSGPCVNGKDTVQINVLNTFSAPGLGGNQSLAPFCNNAGASAFVLTAAAPAQNIVSAAWTVQSQPSGSPVVSFGSPNNNSTTVSNLAGSGTYVFRYTASNGNCSAFVDHTVFFTPPITGLSTPGTQIVPCNDSQSAVSFTYSYGGSTNAAGLTRTATVISQPTGANATTTRAGNPGSDTWTVKNMGKTGAYVVRFEWTNPCGSQYRDVTFYTSFPSGAVNAGSDPLMACNVTFTTMSGNPPPSGVTGTWSQVSGPNQANITQPNNPGCLMTGMVPGTYTFRWQLSSGSSCLSSSDEAVAVVASASVVAANCGPDRAVCNSFPVKLTANQPGPTQTGTWTSIPAGGTVADAHAPNTTVTGLSANTTYKFIWTIANACDTARDTCQLTTNSATTQLTVSAGVDQCKASGTTTASLSGSAPGSATAKWVALDGGTLATPNAQNTTVTLSGNGVYRFVYSLGIAACDTLTDTVSVQISPAATTANAGADQLICMAGSPATINLSGNTPVQGTPRWSLIDGNAAATVTSPTSPSTTATGLLAGNYFFEYRIENGFCPASKDTVRVLLGTPPSTAVASTTTPTLCNAASGNVTLNATAPTVGTGAWSVLAAPPGAPTATITNANTNAATVPVTSLITGQYKFKYTISNGPTCPTSQDSVTVDITRPASSMGTSDVALCNVTSINLVGTPNTTGTWSVTSKPASSPAVTLGSAFGNQATASNLVQGDYQFTYTIPAVGSCASTTAIRKYINGTPAPVAAAGADQYLCTGVTTATLTGNTAAVAGASWSRVSGPNTGTAGTANGNYADTTINGLIEGVYTFRYTTKGTGSCPTESDDLLVVLEKAANAGADKAICGGPTVQMTANVPAYYSASWSQVSGPNTATFSNAAAPNTAVGNLIPGTYYFKYEIGQPAGCAVNSATVKVQVDQPITGFSAGADVSVCKGSSSFTIGPSAVSGVSYSWNPTTSLSASNIAQPTFSPATEGTFTYLVTATRGACSAADDISVVVKPLPTVPQFSVPAAVCGNAAGTITITNADPLTTYTWSGGYGTGPSKTVAPGTYTITTLRDGCAGTAPASVTLNAKTIPSAAFTASSSCNPTFTVTTPTSGATYAWNFGAGATPGSYTGTTANQGPISYSPMGAKTVSLIVAAPNGCSDTVSTAFTASCIPPGTQFSASTTELCTGPVTFTNTTTVGDGPFTYNYNFGDGTPAVTTANATHTYGTAGTYTVTFTVTGAAGSVSATKTITVKQRPASSFTINATPQPLSTNLFTFTATGPAANLYNWTFGDGAIGQYATVSRTYAAAGVYNVTLTATDVVNGCTSTTTKSVTVTSDSVSSGTGGGIESESLGGLVTRRDFNRLKFSLNSPLVYKAMPVFDRKLNVSAVAKTTGGVQGLSDMMPATLAPGDVPRVSTPTDLTALTIAAEVLSVDYTRQDINKAVVLGIKTYDRAYNHTKSICDRFRGATLLSIEPVTLRGMQFSRFALQREDGVVEHAIAFDAGRSAASGTYRLQSDWVISAYAKDDTVYNFQVWATTPDDAEKLALDVLDKQNSYRSLERYTSGVTVPPVYVTKGIRHKDTLLLTVRNTGEATTAVMDFNVQNREEGDRSDLQVSVALNAHTDTVVALPIGDGYEYEGLMHAGSQLVDQFYLADGNWGLDYDSHYTSIKNYAPDNDPGRVYGEGTFPLYRKVDLKTVSSDYVTLYKAIKPGTEPANLSQYHTLKFHAAGTGKAVVRVTRGGITDWAAQYKTEIELTEGGKDYTLAFEDFTSDKLSEAFAPKDAKTLSFTLASADGKETPLNLAVSGVEFSKATAKSVRSLTSKALSVSPNPTKGPFSVTFSADAARELLLTVSDLTGRVLWEQPVQAAVGTNSVDVRVQQALPAGTTLFVNLRDGGTKYDPVKVTVQ